MVFLLDVYSDYFIHQTNFTIKNHLIIYISHLSRLQVAIHCFPSLFYVCFASYIASNNLTSQFILNKTTMKTFTLTSNMSLYIIFFCLMRNSVPFFFFLNLTHF